MARDRKRQAPAARRRATVSQWVLAACIAGAVGAVALVWSGLPTFGQGGLAAIVAGVLTGAAVLLALGTLLYLFVAPDRALRTRPPVYDNLSSRPRGR